MPDTISSNEFISHASHELKTPITTIKGYTEILLKLLKDQPKPFTYLTRMNEQVDRLTSLINEILDVSRIRSGRLTLTKELVDLDKLLKDVTIWAQEQTKHPLVYHGGQTFVVSGDRHRLAQIFSILLSNAIMFSPDSHPIEVTLGRKGKHVYAAVTDHGIGIEKVHYEKIFEPFFQTDEAKKHSQTGWGLGLYIAREIARRHEGDIEVASQKNKGSTFTLVLPLAKPL